MSSAWLACHPSLAGVEHSNLIEILRAYQGQTTAVSQSSAAPTPEGSEPSQGMVIVPGDVLELVVVDDDLLSLSPAPVERDGSIHHPVLGSLRVQGQTLSEARASIEALIIADYLVSPQVGLRLLRQGMAHYTVQGRVLKPGQYPYPRGADTSLAQALDQAGGIHGEEPVQVIIERWQPGRTNLVRSIINVTPPQQPPPEPILPGDRIRVTSLPIEDIVAPVP